MDLLDIRGVPYMARRNYFYEVHHLMLWGLFAGLVEGTVSAVVVSKTFGGSDFLITVVQATPAFANLVSLFWGALLVGRRKLPIFMGLGAAAVTVTLSVFFTPHTPMGGWIFALQICLSRLFMTGVVTARASLWKSNYPRSHRGRISARLQVVRTLMSLPIIFGGGVLFDVMPEAYRWFYPTVAILGLAGMWVLRNERVRGEKTALAGRRRVIGGTNGNSDGEPLADTAIVDPFSLVTLLSPRHLIGRMRRVLREDPRFARYCKAQMCIGSSNLMVMAVNTIILTKVLALSYTRSNGLLDVIPRVVTIAMLPIWAKLFDRVGVLRFRVANSLCWSGSILLCGIGALFAQFYDGAIGEWAIAAQLAYFLGRIVEGMAQSGGAIAWNIGHLHFAEDEKAELYMGIHVSLTGLRGMIAPFLGTFIYLHAGALVFVVALVICFCGMAIFASLAREEKASSAPVAVKPKPHAEPATPQSITESVSSPATTTVESR